MRPPWTGTGCVILCVTGFLNYAGVLDVKSAVFLTGSAIFFAIVGGSRR